jgi:hypothetical protein
MAIPLEDNVSDIVGKAQRGLGISNSQLAEKAGVSAEEVRKLRSGDLVGEAIDRVAPALRLSAPALRKLAAGDWEPEAVGPIDGLAMFNTTYGDMTVNCVPCLGSGDARRRGLRHRRGLQRDVETGRG